MANPRLYKSTAKRIVNNGDVKLVWKQEEIKWGDDLIFVDFAGTDITIRHSPHEGTKYKMTKKTENIIKPARVGKFIREVAKGIQLLYLEHGITNPMVLKVDEYGRVNLLMATMCNKSTILDMHLRKGNIEVVTKSKDIGKDERIME